MSKKYEGYKIIIEQVTGFVARVENEKGEVINDDESLSLHDTKSEAEQEAMDFIDAVIGMKP